MRLRNSDGNVPNVNWNDDKLNVNWYNPDNANDNLRARIRSFINRNPVITGFLYKSMFNLDILSNH